VAEIQIVGKVPIESQIGASGFDVSRIQRTRLPEHQKSRNREKITAVDLGRDMCCDHPTSEIRTSEVA
jgi:hypothetical protein